MFRAKVRFGLGQLRCGRTGLKCGVCYLYEFMFEVFVHLGRLCGCVFCFRRCFTRPLYWWPCLCLVQVDFFRLSGFVGVCTLVVV